MLDREEIENDLDILDELEEELSNIGRAIRRSLVQLRVIKVVGRPWLG